MKKKTTAAIIIAVSVRVISLILIGVLLFAISELKNYLYIENDSLSFETTTIELFLKKGIPSDTFSNPAVSPTVSYTYNEKINGYSAECSYDFVYGGLYDADICIKDIEYDKAVSMCEEMMQKQEKHYSKYDGYYNHGIEENDQLYFEAACGVGFGATSIDFDYKYESGDLTINAMYLR